jgi:hypothetical protein
MPVADHDADENDDDGHVPGHDVVVHLQTAALEVIAAVRAVLDAAEGVVRDPGAAVSLAASVAARARAGHAGSDGEDDGSGGIEHIPVSG